MQATLPETPPKVSQFRAYSPATLAFSLEIHISRDYNRFSSSYVSMRFFISKFDGSILCIHTAYLLRTLTVHFLSKLFADNAHCKQHAISYILKKTNVPMALVYTEFLIIDDAHADLFIDCVSYFIKIIAFIAFHSIPFH